MDNPKIDEAFLEALETFIRTRNHNDDGYMPSSNITAYLVGSRAKGCARLDSDWDVLVVHPMFMSFDRRVEIGDDIIFHKGDVGCGYIVDFVVINPDDWRNSRADYIVDARKCAIGLFSIESNNDGWGSRILIQPNPTQSAKA